MRFSKNFVSVPGTSPRSFAGRASTPQTFSGTRRSPEREPSHALELSRPGRRGSQEVSVAEHELVKNDLARKDKALSEMAVEFTILKKKVNGE